MTDNLSDKSPIDPKVAEMAEKIQAAAKEELGPYAQLMHETIDRVTDLVQVFAKVHMSSSTENERRSADDILRAAVVFMHAYLEDFLRTLAATFLPESDETTLNEIPLAGLNRTGRAEKFLLGKLKQHKGKLVDDIIRESVSDHLGRSNFSDVREIARLLESLGFDISQHNKHFADIDAMMKRRHLIVHRADSVKMSGSEQYIPQAIQASEVANWIGATVSFMSSLLQPIFMKQNPPAVLASRFNFRIVDKKQTSELEHPAPERS